MSDTLFLAVSFVDRFLSTRQVQRNHLQLVGVSCMLIAAKYEEIYAPQVARCTCIMQCPWDRSLLESACSGSDLWLLSLPASTVGTSAA